MPIALRVVCSGLMLLVTATLAGQAQQSATPLSAGLRTHLQAEQFQIVTGVRGFPLGVRDKLAELFGGGTLDIANPSQPFQGAGRPSASLPLRRLIAAGCASDNHCLIYYEKGGAAVTYRAALFHWSPSETRLEFGGTAPAGLSTVDAVKKAMLSGAVKPPAAPW